MGTCGTQENPRVKVTNAFGAFTARSIAGMVGDIGLLTKSGLPYLAEVFLDFENRLNPRYRPAYKNIPFPNKPSASDPLYGKELERVYIFMPVENETATNLVQRGLTRLNIAIKAIGVWDTVGKASF